jgi:hypothetical protein
MRLSFEVIPWLNDSLLCKLKVMDFLQVLIWVIKNLAFYHLAFWPLAFKPISS